RQIVELARLVETLEVRVEPEDGRAVSRRVGLHPFEDTRAVLQPVRENVHFRIVPRDQFAVEPNRFGRSESHKSLRMTIYRNARTGPIPVRTCPNFVLKNDARKRSSR